MIEIKGLKKSFGANEVLKGVDLNVEKGDVVAVLGTSGSGKTTLLRCMNFLAVPDEGTMIFDGETVDLPTIKKKDIARLRKKTAFVFQDYYLFRNKTALENVTEGLIIALKMPKTEARLIGMEMLTKVGLPEKADSYPSELSGGQQQRVAIARALASDPEIIYFDEPTSALDPELTVEVLEVIKKLAAEGRTMVVVTHEMGFARRVSTKVIFMENGTVLAAGPTESFFTEQQNERVKNFIKTLESEK